MVAKEQQIDVYTYNHRENLKQFYSSEMGLMQLQQLVMAHRIGQRLESAEDVANYNLGIQLLEEIGILDEEGVKPTLEWMLKQCSFKRPVEENKENI